jgi:hypothetical protein
MKIIQKTSCLNFSPFCSAKIITSLVKACAVAMAFSLVACATTAPVPNLALQAAETAINNADQERVSDYALPELGEARHKLTSARAAVQAKDMVLARNLADESRVSAELASAKAEQIKANEINENMKKSIQTLNQEMQRNNGEQQ